MRAYGVCVWIGLSRRVSLEMSGVEERVDVDVCETQFHDPVAARQLGCPCARPQSFVVIASFADVGPRHERHATDGQRCVSALSQKTDDQSVALQRLHVGVCGLAVGYLAELPPWQCAVSRAHVTGGLEQGSRRLDVVEGHVQAECPVDLM